MSQPPLFPGSDPFDAEASEAGKDEGMREAASNRRELLLMARRLAVEVALSRSDRTCTADDVQRALYRRGISVFALGNAAGSIFAGKQWEFTGEWVKSERAHAHSNPLRVWRYKGE